MSSRSMVRDSLGRPVRLGSKISYPVRKGSNMWLQHGIVKEFRLASENQCARVEAILDPTPDSKHYSPGRSVRFSSFDRAVVTSG